MSNEVVEANIIERPEPTSAVSQRTSGESTALGFMVPVPELAKALATAQSKVLSVAHDRTNQFHRYDYTSTEALILAGKVLADCALSLLPVEQSVNWIKEEDRYELCRKFVLLHNSGQQRLIVVNWPIVPDKGRPLDKAVGAAATTSLGYLLRDLLLMPRVDQADDMAGRQEQPQQQPAKATPPKQQAQQPVKTPAAPAPKPPKPEPAPGKPLADWLKLFDAETVATGKATRGELCRHVVDQITKGTALGKNPAEWPADRVSVAVKAAREFFSLVKARKLPATQPDDDDGLLINAQQRSELKALAERAGLTLAEVCEHAGIGDQQSEMDMTVAQWRTEMDRLADLASAPA